MSHEGMKRISGLRDDDLFLTFDADEIPKPEVNKFITPNIHYYLILLIITERSSNSSNFMTVTTT